MRGAAAPVRQLDGPAQHRLRRPQALLDDRGQRRDRGEHVAEITLDIAGADADANHPLAGGVEAADVALAADHQESGGHAGDDLAAETLGGLGARLHRALLDAELLDGVAEGAGHERALVALGAVAARQPPYGRDQAEHGEGGDRHHCGDDRGQYQEENAGAGHRMRGAPDGAPGASYDGDLAAAYWFGRSSCRNVSVLTSRNIGVAGGSFCGSRKSVSKL